MADVSIDSTIGTSTARIMRSVAFLPDNDQIGYWFYIDSTNDFSYRKSTDGGATWGAPVVIQSGTHLAGDIWPDWWTPGDSGRLIHFCWFGTVTDDVNYQSLDTTTDTLGTARVVFNGATAVAGRGVFASLTKTRSGILYCAYDIDAGAEKGFHRSTDGGTTWSANLATTFVEATIDQCLLFPASGTGDDDDCFALYQDASVNALTLKTWDSSAGAQTESATIATQGESTTDLTGQYGFAGAVRHSDGHILAAVRTAGLGAAGAFEFYDIASTSSWTKKTNLASGIDDNWYPQVFIDQTTDEIYVAYNGKRDGTEAIGASSSVWYSHSSDGGATWDAEHAYMEGAAGNVVQTWAPLSGSRFYVGWRVGSTLIGNAVNSLSFSGGGGGGSFQPAWVRNNYVYQ